MFIEGQIPNRQKDEKLILFLRRSPFVLFSRWLLYLLLGLIPIGVYFFLIYLQPNLLTNNIIYIFLFLLGSIYYLYLVLFIFSAFIDYYLDVWIVTDQRIINIEQKGLFNREIAEQGLDRIQDVSAIQKGVLQTFFSFGDIHVQTAGEIQRFIFQQISHPFDVVKTINSVIEKKERKFEAQLEEKINPSE